MSSIQSTICQAVSMIAEKAILNAGFDKTVQATIISCVDPSIGKYKVRYQDGYWYAFSNNIDLTYSNGSNVYVLIPNGNMSNIKTIIGAVNQLGINYVSITEGGFEYATIGNDVLQLSNELSLCSYKDEQKIIYQDGSINLIDFNQEKAFFLKEYLNQSQILQFSAIFRTTLPLQQQYQGNYGIVIDLDFIDNSISKNIVTRRYIININSMNGNPYTFTEGAPQTSYYQIDGKNFLKIKRITIFCKNFPNQKTDKPNDIFINSIKVQGAYKIPQDDLDSCALVLLTPKGYIFNSTSKEKRKIIAQVRVKGKVIDNNSQKLKYFWFKQNNKINSMSQKYSRYGGQGWQCLNEFFELSKESTTPIISFISGEPYIQISNEDCLCKKNKYKCVVLYGQTVLKKQIYFINNKASYQIFIESNPKDLNFNQDSGIVKSLQCIVKQDGEIITNGLQYSWSIVNDVGIYNSIDSKEKILSDININSITSFCIYKCSVFNLSGTLIGTTSITISNSLSSQNNYHLIINNSNEIFKYSNTGISPTSEQNDHPIFIPSLTFSIFDNRGQEIDQNNFTSALKRWYVPVENTLLIPNQNYEYSLNEDGSKKVFSGLSSFTYTIEDRYDYSKSNNLIQLEVQYKGNLLQASTNLIFLKDGESGTNGTDYVCKIVPNTIDGIVPVNPILTLIINSNQSSGSMIPNWNVNGSNLFKVNLWHNGGSPIFSGARSGAASGDGVGGQVSVTWSMLKNKYKVGVQDFSFFIFNDTTEKTGVFQVDYSAVAQWRRSNYKSSPANILRATVEYQNFTYYADLPIITVIKNSSFQPLIRLKNYSGFMNVLYNSSGMKPMYDSHSPFEIQIINNNNQHIQLNNTFSYSWNTLGSTYVKQTSSSTSTNWIQLKVDYLKIFSILQVLNKNQKAYYPQNTYDGQAVNIGVYCRILKNNTQIGVIHIPIHFLRNRFQNSMINEWDGNSIQINQEGGMILAPQVGAGYKDANNSFTGLVMGVVQDPKQVSKINSHLSYSDKDVGLLGYAKGERSIFLDAKTGKAVFGTNSLAQIVINPDQNSAKIQSGNYVDSASNGKGMLLNLSQPFIKFGNHKFIVDENGHLTSTSATIGGWQVSSTSISKGSGSSVVGLSSKYQNKDSIAIWAGRKEEDKDNAPFKITYGGDGFFKGTITGSKIIGTTIQNAATNPSFSISSSGSIIGANLTVGGLNDRNGYIIVKDNRENEIIKLNQNGITFSNGAYIKWSNIYDPETGEFASGKTTRIINDTVTTSYVNALEITAKQIKGRQIEGYTIIGTTIKNSATNPSFMVTSTGEIIGASLESNNGKFQISRSGNITGATIQGSTLSGNAIYGAKFYNSKNSPELVINTSDDLHQSEVALGMVERKAYLSFKSTTSDFYGNFSDYIATFTCPVELQALNCLGKLTVQQESTFVGNVTFRSPISIQNQLKIDFNNSNFSNVGTIHAGSIIVDNLQTLRQYGQYEKIGDSIKRIAGDIVDDLHILCDTEVITDGNGRAHTVVTGVSLESY